MSLEGKVAVIEDGGSELGRAVAALGLGADQGHARLEREIVGNLDQARRAGRPLPLRGAPK